MIPNPGREPASPAVNWLQALINRLPERWRKPAMWTVVALALAAAGWLLPGSNDAGGTFLDNAALVASVILKLGFVLVLVYACLWLLRRWQGATHGQQRRLALLETLRLSSKQALHVVRAGDQVLLIGATDQAISVLAEVHQAGFEAAETLGANAAPGSGGFDRLLARFAQTGAAQAAARSQDMEGPGRL